MNDDDRNVSARQWRAVREGDAHAAPKTTQNNTPESFIVGVGASGALLAGAAIVFVTLVGLVSFNVWPTAQDASTDGNVELSAATPSAPANNNSNSNNTVVPVSAAAGQLAATNVGTSGGSGGAGNGGNNQGGNGKPKPAPAPTPPGTAPTPPGTAPTPPGSGGSTGTGDGSTGSGGPVTATKDPSHVVTPTHPSDPHQNTPEEGQDPGDVGDGVDIGVIGKPPLDRPPSIPPPGDETSPDQGGSTGDNEPSSDQGGSTGDNEPSSDQGESSGDSGSSGPPDDDPSASDGSHGCSHSDHQD